VTACMQNGHTAGEHSHRHHANIIGSRLEGAEDPSTVFCSLWRHVRLHDGACAKAVREVPPTWQPVKAAEGSVMICRQQLRLQVPVYMAFWELLDSAGQCWAELQC